MILAQALQRHLLGRDWRWPSALPLHTAQQQQQQKQQTAAPGEAPPELARLLQLFWDTPAGATRQAAGCPACIHMW
jgi:hypothetical protein